MKQTDTSAIRLASARPRRNSQHSDNDTNVMDLDKHARISDASGSTTADNIRLDQTTGDFDANGHVSTTRLPESQQKRIRHARSGRAHAGYGRQVTSANRNHLIHYVGNAVVWQSSSRIQADRIDIDRDKKSMVADGKVITQFEDKPKDRARPRPRPARLSRSTHVHHREVAAHGLYGSGPSGALTRGGVDFWRPSMTVKSASLKAYLNQRRFRRGFAHQPCASETGRSKWCNMRPDRQRVGNSEHAEYYTEDGKVILTGGNRN